MEKSYFIILSLKWVPLCSMKFHCQTVSAWTWTGWHRSERLHSKLLVPFIYLPVNHWGQTRILIFLSGIQQRSVNDSYHKHFSLGDNLQNFAEGRDEDFMEEVIFLDLLEVKAADYEDDQEQVKKQQANIFVPSNSPGKVFTRKYSSH